MNMIRKGQVRWLAKGNVTEQVRFINVTFGLTADATAKTSHTWPVVAMLLATDPYRDVPGTCAKAGCAGESRRCGAL